MTLGGGLLENVISAFDRARRVLSEYIVGLIWSNAQANRPRIYCKFSDFSGFFSSFLVFFPPRGGLFEKAIRASDRACRVLSWSNLGQIWSNAQANSPGKYSNPPKRYPT